MARTSLLEVVAGSRIPGTWRRSHSRRQSSGTKALMTTTSLSHSRCRTRIVGGWTSSGKGHWSSGSMPGQRRLLAPAVDASQLQRHNSAAAHRTVAEAILREEHDSKQLNRDEGGEQGVSAHGRTKFKDRTAAYTTLFDATVTSTRSSYVTRPTRRRSRPARQLGSGTLYSSRSTTTRT